MTWHLAQKPPRPDLYDFLTRLHDLADWLEDNAGRLPEGVPNVTVDPWRNKVSWHCEKDSAAGQEALDRLVEGFGQGEQGRMGLTHWTKFQTEFAELVVFHPSDLDREEVARHKLNARYEGVAR